MPSPDSGRTACSRRWLVIDDPFRTERPPRWSRCYALRTQRGYLQRGREGGRSPRSEDRGFRSWASFLWSLAYSGSSDPLATAELALEAGAAGRSRRRCGSF
jgi:hypothetical protein